MSLLHPALKRLQSHPTTSKFIDFDWLENATDIDWDARQGPEAIEFFVRDVIGVVNPYPYQIDALRTLLIDHRVAMYGPHGIGKTALMAWAILYFLWAYPRSVKIITTASVWSQLTDYLWPEINMWAQRVAWAEWGILLRPGKELGQIRINIRGDNKLVTARSPRLGTEETVEGAHADRVMWVFDEAKIVDDRIWDAAEGAMATGEGYILAASTPGDTVGRFWQICTRKPGYLDWTVKPVTLEMALENDVLKPEFVAARREQWEETQPADWHNRILGVFYESSPDALIPPHWVDHANQRFDELKRTGDLSKREFADVAYGADIAEYGDDKTMLWKLSGNVALWYKEMRKKDNVEVVRQFNIWMAKDKGAPIAIDGIGLGAGVWSTMKHEKRFNAMRVDVRESTKLRSRDGNSFANLRSALWWLLREALDPDGDVLLALPRNDLLYQELTAPNWWHRSDMSAAIVVMNKEDMTKRLKRSPDLAEALMFGIEAMRRRNMRKMQMV